MKTTKHIKTLAAKLAAEDAKLRTYPTSAETYENELEELKRALISGRYYTAVDTVSRSGMSRKIRMAYVKNGKIHSLMWLPGVLRIAGCDVNGRITGCGMDMLFAAQYGLFRAVAPHQRYQDKMARYRDM